MTDQDPVPTERMPLPNEPIGDESAQRGTSAAASEPATASTDTSWSGPPASAPVDPIAPISPVPPAPGRARRRDRDPGRTASVLFGVVVLGLGLWFFAEYTLGYKLPRISWSQLWPVALIAIGLWVVLGSMRRGSP
ncbi:MAG TPA: DUF5668 domain-containing protein [Methylomirabilota bacterium]|nr:DUF5668 domain-containing protein [Methylomirabilota bacterium]